MSQRFQAFTVVFLATGAMVCILGLIYMYKILKIY